MEMGGVDADESAGLLDPAGVEEAFAASLDALVSVEGSDEASALLDCPNAKGAAEFATLAGALLPDDAPNTNAGVPFDAGVEAELVTF